LHFISLVQDITERKKAEEELQLARFCIDHAAVAIFRVADEGKIMDVNEHAYRSLGYSRQELLGMTIFDIDPSFSPEIWVEHRRKLAAERVRVIQAQHRRKDGTCFPIEITANYFEQDGKGFTFSFATDISSRIDAEQDREKLEAQLRQAQKMEAIGTLAGGIAHDFNNILSVIIGTANLLEFSDGLAEADRSGLQQILTAAERARQLVKQILTFSRLGEQQRLLVNLKPVVKETFNFLKATLPSSIEVRQSIHADVGAILADPTQMQQVLMNLCTNAAHAMESQETGVLEIGMEKAWIPPEQARFEPDVEPGEFVKLTVADTGPGIESWVRERMFEPYFTTKRTGKGTGLGLSVVHGIVKAHGGFIKVYSEAGKGTHFHVFLPVAEGDGKTAALKDTRLPRGSETILVVDDEKALTDMAQLLLEHLGYRVETRTSPLEAIEAFRANPGKYHGVITDMTMPQMNGLNLSKKLLEIRADLPILLCTGFSDAANEEKARAVGIREFAFKPLALSDFAKTLRKMLDEAKTLTTAPADQ
jgi:PAS domain S-box-containing protein